MTASVFHMWKSRRHRPVLSDLIAPVFTAPRVRLLVFLLDVSDSMAEAIAELREMLTSSVGKAYFRRDPVAIVTVQGAQARLLVLPTTSVRLILHRLSSLKVGGGTPLDLGLDLVRRALQLWHDRYPIKDLFILSDGRSTGPLSGPGIDRAIAGIRRLTRHVFIFNPISGADPFARDLAEKLGASYLEGDNISPDYS